MNYSLKRLLPVLGLLGAVLGVAAFVLNSQKKACLGGQGKPALDACTFVVKWLPGSGKAPALYKRSRLYSLQQLHDRELADLQAMLPLINSSSVSTSLRAETYAALAVSVGRKGDQAAFLDYSELAVKTGSSDPQVYLSLAKAYIVVGRFQEAAELLINNSGVEKNHPYYNSLAEAYGGMGDFPKAYDALKTGLMVKAPRPVLAETAKHMGLVCFELRRYKEAETYLGYAQRAGTECPECPLLLTTIRESLGAY